MGFSLPLGAWDRIFYCGSPWAFHIIILNLNNSYNSWWKLPLIAPNFIFNTIDHIIPSFPVRTISKSKIIDQSNLVSKIITTNMVARVVSLIKIGYSGDPKSSYNG